VKLNQVNRRRFLRALLYGLPALAGADVLWVEPAWFKVIHLRLAKDKPVHRFIHFTDLHHKGDRAFLESVVKRINALSPEFVCFSGDIVEDTKYLDEALELLRGIK